MGDLNQRLAAELARVLTHQEDTETLLREAGFPLEQVPQSATPLTRWSRIVELASFGVLQGGVQQLARTAARRFPYNETLARCLGDECRSDGNGRTWNLTLKIDDLPNDKLHEILDTLRQIVGEEISLIHIDKGSVILVLKMSDKAASRLKALTESGELSKVLGLGDLAFGESQLSNNPDTRLIQLTWKSRRSGEENKGTTERVTAHASPPSGTSKEELTVKIRKRMGQDSGLGATLKFDLGDDGIIFLDGRSIPNSVTNDDADADCTMGIALADLKAMLSGDLDPMIAFSSGKLRVEGDVGAMAKLGNIVGDAD